MPPIQRISGTSPATSGRGRDDWRTTPAGAVRAGDWKLLEFFEDRRLELHNLKDDVGEKNDLAEARPEKVKELHGKLRAWREAVKAPRAGPARRAGKP